VEELWEAIEKHRAHLESTGRLVARRRDRILAEIETMVAAELRARAAALLSGGGAEDLADDLAEGRTDPYRAAAEVLRRLADTAP
jgi:LAO/AO transport system kinase